MPKIELPSNEAIEHQLETLRLEDDLLAFLLWLFEVIKREEFLENWHHRQIANALMAVYRGEITHLIINLPPRYTKTELVIKAFVAWCLAKNPKCKFIHLSYSDDLALDNSSAIREIITSDEYQERWPMLLKQDSQAKKKWFNHVGGGMYAVATGGQITGFGAGAVQSPDMPYEFAGAILIDDPLKPDDASSDTVRTRINDRFNNTIKSRTNSKKTPIIIIMQRLHEDDLAGFLLDGGSEFNWTHVNMPAINEDGPSKYDPRQVGAALWPDKHNTDDLEAQRLSDAETFAGQMQQRPAPAGGNIFKRDYLQYYMELPNSIIYRCHSWDLTFKEKSKVQGKKTDFVVGTEWGLTTTGDIYLMPDMVRDRMGADRTLDAIKAFINRHPNYKAMLIEDKANGPAVISMLRKQGLGKRLIEIEPNGTKVERAKSQVPLFRSGNIYFPDPAIAPWVRDFVAELLVFPNGKHDDQVDSATQAIQHLDDMGDRQSMAARGKKTEPYRKEFEKKTKKASKTRIKVKSY